MVRQTADDASNDLQIEIVHGIVACFDMRLSLDLLASCRCASCSEVLLAVLKTHYYYVDPETFHGPEESPTYSSERAVELLEMIPMLIYTMACGDTRNRSQRSLTSHEPDLLAFHLTICSASN